MSSFSQQVFIISLVMSLVLGSLAGALFRGSKQQTWLLPYCIVATLAHLTWLAWPIIPPAARDFVRLAFSIWVGIVLVATALLPLFALTYIIVRVRGQALSHHLPAIYVSICFLFAVALCVGGSSLNIREETIVISELDPRLDGFRIANFGDVHVDRFISPADLAEAVDTVASRGVDVLALTGDLIDDHRLIEPTLDALDDARIASIVAVIGNHEKMGRLEPVIRAYENRSDRISLLVDSSTTVDHAGARAHFVGIDYAMGAEGGHMLPDAEQRRVMVRQASSVFPASRPGEAVIALSHHPEFFPVAAAHGAQLTLSSHTHGGQVRAFGRPLINAYEYMAGRYEANNAHLDVSAGFGHWLPLRLGVPREVVVVTLRRAPARDSLAQSTLTGRQIVTRVH